MTDDFNLSDYEHELDNQPTFDDALEEIKSADSVPDDQLLYGLSDLTYQQLEKLKPVWQGKSADYRRILMQMLVDASESDFMLNFRQIGWMNLDAEEPMIRQAAIEMLWEEEQEDLLERLIDILRHDPNETVRAEAAGAIGRFVLLGELGDLSPTWQEKAQEALIAILQQPGTSEIVYQRALESIGNCTREDVPPIIQYAYETGDESLQISAIVAMGRTCDSERWRAIILKELENSNSDVRREAARAAGELQLSETVPALVRIIEDDKLSNQEVAIWALGEIGGEAAKHYLNRAADAAELAGDDDLQVIIEEAIANAELMDGSMLLLDFDEDFLEPDQS